MPKVTKHDGEQERERDASEETSIDFSITSDSVRIDDFLEPMSELVCAVERWRSSDGWDFIQQRGYSR